jgi:hypothetical protein
MKKKSKDDDQLFLNLGSPPDDGPTENGPGRAEPPDTESGRAEPAEPAPRESVEREPVFSPLNLKKAVLGWLMTRESPPSGFAVDVPTRISKHKADVASFRSAPGKKGILSPIETIVVETRGERGFCWPECSGHEEILKQLRGHKDRLKAVQAEIREREPSLRDNDGLFDEYESWDYSKSSNKEYHILRREIEDLEHSLYKGSKFERIRASGTADLLYLATPEGMIQESELANGWGLIYVSPSLKCKVIKEAEFRDCPPENRFHLAQNIAAAARKMVLFSLGAVVHGKGDIEFLPPPRRRRPIAE